MLVIHKLYLGVVNLFGLASFLFPFEGVAIVMLLELLIGKIDTELFKGVDLIEEREEMHSYQRKASLLLGIMDRELNLR